MFVNAGELNKRIQILQPTETRNSGGFAAPATEPDVVHSCWAKFSQTSGTTLVKANADFSEEKVRFLIRYTAKEITTKMYVRYGGSRYDIEYINDYGDAHKYIELWCTWRGKEGRP